MPLTQEELRAVEQIHRLFRTVGQIIIGKEEVTKLTLTAMLAGGHVLFEDIPGVGKTLLVKTIAKCLGADFSRIQFTPDLVPSDIVGFSMPRSGQDNFVFRKGPIFSSIVLADEINRTSPRTQAAMLEAMAEQQVTSDGITYQLPQPFFVLATQNPIEYEGTYPLPEAQLDRFLMQLSLGYPNQKQEVEMLAAPNQMMALQDLEPILPLESFLQLKASVPRIHIEESLLQYVVDLGNLTRSSAHIRLGISPRGNQFCVIAAKAYALLDGRSYVIPDDIKAVLPAVYRHRILFYDSYSSQQTDEAIQALLKRVSPPIRR
ncbi:AAA family ATPase [Jeotgalibaca caeni]|uniref:AAA family ATPase n=1 Tax=Jeotgalibaca caeni TaxID=3028623 RepID=UPI00237E508B|nr:MoxR family ATPase [Jeotgalibaca caeni]MDE1548367.1 MoxR family ATPase [Jeotgalibaca caeni]